MKVLTIALAAAMFALPVMVVAHPGGLNSEGCRNDRKNDSYHCHNSIASPAPPLRQGLSSSGSSRAFRNCDEARAAGAAPVLRGQPGYVRHLDRDGDGVACEPYLGR